MTTTDKPRDPVQFRRWLGIRAYSPAWEVTLKAAWGTPLTPEERPLWKEISGHGEERPGVGWTELMANVGRGGGKDDAIKTVVNFECRFGDHEIAAAPGQRLPALVICPLRSQAQGMLRMIAGEAKLPKLRSAVLRITADAVEYRNGLIAQVQTCSDVAVTGDTVPIAVRNEWAQFPGEDSATPDHVIEANLRPALRQIEGTPPHRLIGITSSYTTDSLAYKTFSENWGRADADVLVVQGPTWKFNPNIDPEYLAKERRRLGDRAYAMHFENIWTAAVIESWFGSDVINRCVDKGRHNGEPVAGRRYYAAVDLGLRVDSTALVICHREQRDSQTVTVVDGVWYWPSGSATMGAIVSRASKIIREWRATAFTDNYSVDFAKGEFARERVHVLEAPWNATGGQSKTIRFNWVRLHMLDGRVRFPDDEGLKRELHNFGGRLRRNGTEELAARTGHDDRVTAMVCAVSEAIERCPDRRGESRWEREEREQAERAVGLALGGGGFF